MPFPRFRHALLALGLALAPFAAATAAETVTETKIRLLSEALRARDSGELDVARARLQELQTLAPGDQTISRLLAGLTQPADKKITVQGGESAAPAPVSAEASAIARAEEDRLNRLLSAAAEAQREARALAAGRQYGSALARLTQAETELPENPLTQSALADLRVARAEIAAERDRHLAELSQPTPVSPSAAAAVETPAAPAPPPAASRTEIDALVARGRSQYLAGEPSAAAQTFARVLELDPINADADAFLRRIARGSVDGNADRARTSAQLLNEVARAWQRPGVTQEPAAGATVADGPSPLWEKLNQIILPSVNFNGLELHRVVNTLSTVSEEFDRTGTDPKGVNVVLVDPSNANPPVSISLRNLSLKRVLDFITDSVGYQYEVQADAVVIRPGGELTSLDTQFFPVSRSTVLRMTGRGSQGSGSDPQAGGAAGGAAAQTIESEGKLIQNFLQLAGVSFEGVDGSTLAFDGSQLIVTQTGRNLERIRNILARYSEVRQVEIEAKFMEVQDGALEELGINWNIGKKSTQHSGASVTNYATGNRSLAGTFSNAVATTQGLISRPESPGVFRDNNGNGVFDAGDTMMSEPTTGINLPIINNAPSIPGTNNLGVGANPLATITGILGEFNVNAVIRALSQRSGTELLSAPKLTVLSGNPATITVAQELRYPQSYGQVQSQVGTGNASGGGSAGVTITAGTPQEFTTRNVGVELRVTPTVEEDDYSISLDLNPKVTEFEGFVEYGGQSVAVSGSTTVTVPSGFYQPIFAIREVTTKVTIWDGATLVMGGLTREDTRKTNDKVPVVGNLPVLGRLFRSSGESAQKRNLLIFVTANLVSPGGSLKKQGVPGAPANSLYQNPTIVTPAGAAGRKADK